MVFTGEEAACHWCDIVRGERMRSILMWTNFRRTADKRSKNKKMRVGTPRNPLITLSCVEWHPSPTGPSPIGGVCTSPFSTWVPHEKVCGPQTTGESHSFHEHCNYSEKLCYVLRIRWYNLISSDNNNSPSIFRQMHEAFQLPRKLPFPSDKPNKLERTCFVFFTMSNFCAEVKKGKPL